MPGSLLCRNRGTRKEAKGKPGNASEQEPTTSILRSDRSQTGWPANAHFREANKHKTSTGTHDNTIGTTNGTCIGAQELVSIADRRHFARMGHLKFNPMPRPPSDRRHNQPASRVRGRQHIRACAFAGLDTRVQCCTATQTYELQIDRPTTNTQDCARDNRQTQQRAPPWMLPGRCRASHRNRIRKCGSAASRGRCTYIRTAEATAGIRQSKRIHREENQRARFRRAGSFRPLPGRTRW